MKAKLISTTWLGVMSAVMMVVSAFNTPVDHNRNYHGLSDYDDQLKKEAFQILNPKCNVCHCDQNPVLVFKENNMTRRAEKIYRTVYVEQRMPKGNEIRFTRAEYTQVDKWLRTQKIY